MDAFLHLGEVFLPLKMVTLMNSTTYTALDFRTAIRPKRPPHQRPQLLFREAQEQRSDPYIISDPFSVSSRSIRSYMFAWHMEHYVYFQWDVGNHAGEWAVSIDATPASHVFDLFGRDDQGDTWDDTDGNWRSRDASIIISVQSGGHVYIRIKSRDEFNYPPIGLTLTIRPPALADVTEQTATATPTPTSTPAASTPTPTATPTIASSPFTSGGSGTSSDPYVISDPTGVSSRSIRSYVSDLQAQQSVYFRWDVGGDRLGIWRVSIDASPSSHDFDSTEG